jgi:hypothetical protein
MKVHRVLAPCDMRHVRSYIRPVPAEWRLNGWKPFPPSRAAEWQCGAGTPAPEDASGLRLTTAEAVSLVLSAVAAKDGPCLNILLCVSGRAGRATDIEVTIALSILRAAVVAKEVLAPFPPGPEGEKMRRFIARHSPRTAPEPS